MAAQAKPGRRTGAWRKQRAGLNYLFVAILGLILSGLGSNAQTLLRDPDIEHALKQLANPLIATAGLSPARIDVLVIKDDKMNAFIIDDRTVFLHSGLILRLGSAAELQAVIAHEIAHIANGHVSRRMANIRSRNRAAIAGIAVGVAAGLAGAGQAAGGLAVGLSSSAERRFLSHSRAEEAAADASGLRYMAEAGVDPGATVTLLDRFRGQEVLSQTRQDPYVRSHPLTRDRMRTVKGLAAGLRVTPVDQSAANYWFLRARGKLSAFLRKPGWTLRRVEKSDRSDIAVMQRAIAFHRKPDPKAARREIDHLAALRPNDPFVHELRGQILLESGDVRGAVSAYGRAAEIASRNALVLSGLGRSLLASGNHARALEVLSRARDRDPRDPRLLRDLAVAFARSGQTGQASLATAERYALLGRASDAAIHAKRAVGALPTGSPGWRRAQDILSMSDRAN